MILPHPEKDLRMNLMVLGADIISILNRKDYRDKYVLVEDVLYDFLKKDSRRSADLFLYSLLFLYSVGLIEHTSYKIKLIPTEEAEQQVKLLL